MSDKMKEAREIASKYQKEEDIKKEVFEKTKEQALIILTTLQNEGFDGVVIAKTLFDLGFEGPALEYAYRKASEECGGVVVRKNLLDLGLLDPNLGSMDPNQKEKIDE